MIEPIPCPFCGSENIMAEGQENWVAMVCQHCHAQGPKLFSNEEAFIKHPVETVTTLWNRDNPLPEAEVLAPGLEDETGGYTRTVENSTGVELMQKLGIIPVKPLPEAEVLHPGWDAETVIADYTEEKV